MSTLSGQDKQEEQNRDQMEKADEKNVDPTCAGKDEVKAVKEEFTGGLLYCSDRLKIFDLIYIDLNCAKVLREQPPK